MVFSWSCGSEGMLSGLKYNIQIIEYIMANIAALGIYSGTLSLGDDLLFEGSKKIAVVYIF